MFALAACAGARSATSPPREAAASASCTTANGAILGLRVFRTPPPVVNALPGAPRLFNISAVRLSGPCAGEVVAANTSQLLMRSGVVLTIRYVDLFRLRLEEHEGRTSFAWNKWMRLDGASVDGEPVMASSASDPRLGIQYVTARRRGSGSQIGFVWIDDDTGKARVTPVVEVPLPVRTAYFFPALDTHGGTVTALAEDGGDAVLVRIDVAPHRQ